MANFAQKRADRSKPISFRISAKLYAEISNQATIKDLALSEWLRLTLAKAIDDEKQMQAVIARKR